MSIRAFVLGTLMAVAALTAPEVDAKRLSAEAAALKARADAGDAQAQFDLATAYDWGNHGAPRNGRLAMKYYRLAAEQEHLEAMNSLGSGLFAEERYDEARPWLEKAAARGHPLALTSVGFLHDRGLGGLPQDRRKGLEFYTRAAELGDGEAMFGIANQYGAGQLGPIDLVTACAWTVRAQQATVRTERLEALVRDAMAHLETELSIAQWATCRERAAADWPPPASAAAPAGS